MVDRADPDTGSGKTGPVGHPSWLGDTERRLIDQAFEAFAWRPCPAVVVSERERRMAGRRTLEPERVLAGVAVGDLDDERFDAAFPQYLFFHSSLTPEAGLYYTPALISRFIRETERTRRQEPHMTGRSWHDVEKLVFSMLHEFRYRPYNLGWPVSKWPRLLDAAAGDKDALAHPDIAAHVAEEGHPLESERWLLMEDTRRWLMIATPPGRYDGSTWRDTLRLVSLMTLAERYALVAFLDYLALRNLWLKGPDLPSAKALLAGRGVMEVLRIRTAAECIEIADALQALETRHPDEFPPHEVAPVRNLLREIAAGRRSPDTTLGW